MSRVKIKIKNNTLYIGSWWLRRRIVEVPAKGFYPFLLKNRNWEHENCLSYFKTDFQAIRTNLPILKCDDLKEISLHLLKEEKPKIYEELLPILLNLGFEVMPERKSEYEELRERYIKEWEEERKNRLEEKKRLVRINIE